jgi:hypothetical protein
VSAVDQFLEGAAATADPANGPFVKSGRYHLLHPETGDRVTYQRTTNFVKLLADDFHLQLWKQRMVLLGSAMRPDIAARAVAAGADDRKQLNTLAEEALEAAGGNRGSNLGTAMHDLTDRADRGEELELPPPLATDLAAYRQALADAGVIIHSELIERIVCLPELGVAGKFDRIVGWDGRVVVGDLKTQASVDFGWLEIAMQLAVYAHAPFMWDPERGWVEKPAVDLDEALVFHLPAGTGRCELHVVDIAAGWEACTEAANVRDWRRRSKSLARSLAVTDNVDLEELLEASIVAAGGTVEDAHRDTGTAAADTAPSTPPAATPSDEGNPHFEARRDWLRGRLAKALETGGGTLPVGFEWPATVRRFKDGGPRTWQGAAVLEEWLCDLERHLSVPFPESPPPLPEDPFTGFELPDQRAPHRLAPPPEQTPEQAAREQQARTLLDGLDEAEITAFLDIAAAGRPIGAMEDDDVERLGAIFAAVDRGLVGLTYELDGTAVLGVTERAEQALVETFDGKRALAVAACKDVAARYGRPNPRSATQAAADPVLVAVAIQRAGRAA